MTVRAMDAQKEIAQAVKFIAVLLFALALGVGVYAYVHHEQVKNARTQDCLSRLGDDVGHDCEPGSY